MTNYLYNSSLIGREEKEKLHVALLELLINVIEHGNCKIGFHEKSAWLSGTAISWTSSARKITIPP